MDNAPEIGESMTTKIRSKLRSRTTAVICLAFALMAMLPAEVLAYPPNPC